MNNSMQQVKVKQLLKFVNLIVATLLLVLYLLLGYNYF